jgi:hypothetical protein
MGSVVGLASLCLWRRWDGECTGFGNAPVSADVPANVQRIDVYFIYLETGEQKR